MYRLLALTISIAMGLTACAGKVDRFGVDRVLERGLRVPDLGMVCTMGEALVHPLSAITSSRNPAHKVLLISETIAGTCTQQNAWEAETQALSVRQNLGALGAQRTNLLRDLKIQETRAHAATAQRFYRGYKHFEAEYGPIGEACPRIRKDDEAVYLIGLISGVLALMHDKAAGNPMGVPTSTLLAVGRASRCLDSETWWHVPKALEAASFALIPGGEPAGFDAWAELQAAAEAGESSGVRVARAFSILFFANADRDDDVQQGIKAHAQSLKDTKQSTQWALLDEYARLVSLHESDLLWTRSKGYRTPQFGELPAAAAPVESTTPDVFEEDPF
jgi:hypothetical protein